MSAARGPLALTMGEPAGVGGEIALKAWLLRTARQVPPFFLIDDPARITALAARLGWSVPVTPIGQPAQALRQFAEALPVLPVTAPVVEPTQPGSADPANAAAVIAAIEMAVALTHQGQAAALVTNPIHKESLQRAGFGFPGHTEFLAALCGGATPVMMLTCPGLRVVPVTVHMALAAAATALSAETIVRHATITAAALRRNFAIAAPRLVVAALNPHAGEGGLMGDEEQRVIAPAVAQLQAQGLDVRGPLAADSLFHAEARTRYDAALCMYHDQALIPLKTIDFVSGVNITLGLDVVRTSPDHGTALDIAGQGIADPSSLCAALRTAAEIADHRSATADTP